MRNWKRYEEAKRLKDTGLTFEAVGAAMGVSAERVRQMTALQARRQKNQAESPFEPPWWDGLKQRTRRELELAGFESRHSCAAFAADELTIWRGAAVFKDSDDKDWWRWTRKRFPLSMVNEIRAWLGCKPYAKATKTTSATELERARKLLERNGWRVEQPKKP